MKTRCFFLIISWIIVGCSPHSIKPDKKDTHSIELTPFEENGFQKSKLDDWEFLKRNPTENEVNRMFGEPDSTWVDEYDEYKILYYFVPDLQDYNSIEIEIKTGRVSGFEWD
tara:strand:- start:95 stop:430 length:336 start_codon:yes stop_codon:yes gene_type:complete